MSVGLGRSPASGFPAAASDQVQRGTPRRLWSLALRGSHAARRHVCACLKDLRVRDSLRRTLTLRESATMAVEGSLNSWRDTTDTATESVSESNFCESAWQATIMVATGSRRRRPAKRAPLVAVDRHWACQAVRLQIRLAGSTGTELPGSSTLAVVPSTLDCTGSNCLCRSLRWAEPIYSVGVGHSRRPSDNHFTIHHRLGITFVSGPYPILCEVSRPGREGPC